MGREAAAIVGVNGLTNYLAAGGWIGLLALVKRDPRASLDNDVAAQHHHANQSEAHHPQLHFSSIVIWLFSFLCEVVNVCASALM